MLQAAYYQITIGLMSTVTGLVKLWRMMTMLQDRRIWGPIVLASVILGAFIGSAVSQQQSTATVEDPAAVGYAESLSTAFRLAANSVLPTVVKIEATIKPRQVARRGGTAENPFRGTPFEDFFNDPRFNDPRFGQPFHNRTPEQHGTGSGVIIESDGLILTNNHVVGDADEVIVELADGRRFPAEDIRTDPRTDLAVLRISGAGTLPSARLGSSSAMEIGDWVLAIGNPFGLEASVSAGIISAKGRSLRAATRASFLQTDAAINPGNSGGPLVNLRGEVVGISTAIASSTGGYQGIGFAIPTDLAKWVIEQLVSRGSVSRAYLGVKISEITQEIAESGDDIKLGEPGVVVMQVNEGSPADLAGILVEDVITHFAGQPTPSPIQLQKAVERAPLDSRQKVRIIRNGRAMELTMVAKELPDDVEEGRRTGGHRRDVGGFLDEQLGLQVADLTRDVIARMDLPTDSEGVVVVGVVPNGIARAGGVGPGALIIEVGGAAVKSIADYKKAIQDADIERGVRLTIKIPGVGTRLVILKQR